MLATMPPVTEYREEFIREANIPVQTAWAEIFSVPYRLGGWWKATAFSRISKFEQTRNSKPVNTFCISPEVANAVRLQLSKVALQSLPLPAVVPLSGHGLSLTWASGGRVVEMTAFADGEITVDALEANNYVDTPTENLEVVLKWLIAPPEAQLHHATAR